MATQDSSPAIEVTSTTAVPEATTPVETPVEVSNEETKEATKPTETAAATPEEDTKPEPKPEPESKPETKTDSKVGKVTALVEQAGLDMVEVATYAKANDGQIDLDTMAALKEKHGEVFAEMIADQIKGIHTERTAEAQKKDQAVFDQVEEAFKGLTEQSGEESWKELAAWSKDNVSNEDRVEINKLLGQGGLATKLAVQELVSAFKESQGTQEVQEADLLEADTTTHTSTGSISKSDYTRELNALLDKGHVYGESREISQLDARRAKSIQRGL